MPVVWDDKADAMLLVSILATSNTKVDAAAVATMMGGEYNPLAIRNRIGKIKLKAKALAGEVPTPPNTPKTAKQAAGQKRKGASKDQAGDDEPAVKKETPKKAKRAVKAEVKEEE
ncbi:hypothetical protein FQN49_000542 [Arthroderma sp. PD_2]|nr:hypothetical protein FQN49_000542 [Arthroderma sp. PD_2]